MNKKISPIIYRAIEIMRTCFDGTDIELLSTEMYRIPPSEHCKLGHLGVDIKVMGIKTFLGCESMAEDIAWNPHGKFFAEEFIAMVLNEYMKDNPEQIK